MPVYMNQQLNTLVSWIDPLGLKSGGGNSKQRLSGNDSGPVFR
jgi:hypothetical protein